MMMGRFVFHCVISPQHRSCSANRSLEPYLSRLGPIFKMWHARRIAIVECIGVHSHMATVFPYAAPFPSHHAHHHKVYSFICIIMTVVLIMSYRHSSGAIPITMQYSVINGLLPHDRHTVIIMNDEP